MPDTQPEGADSRSVLHYQLKIALEKGKANFHWIQYGKDRKEIPLEITMVRIPWDEGYHIATYARDLRREAAEEAKRRVAEKQTQLMLDSTPLICSMWDENLNMIDCNLEALRLLELDDKTEYIGRFSQFNPAYQPDGEASRIKAPRLLKRVLESGYERFEWEYQTRTGSPLPVEITLIRVNWDDEYRILAYSRDLRELKEAEAKGKEAERRTLLMLDTLPMAAYLISRKHQLVDCNREAVRMFQAKGKEHLIHSFLDDFSPDYQLDGQPSTEKAAKLIDKAFEEGYSAFDWTHQMPNGDIIPAEIILVHVHWKENEDLVCAYARDLRHVKRTEGELLQKSLLLETVNKIAERLLPVNSLSIEKELQASMKYLAQSVNVDSVRIWQNTERNGELYYHLIHSWPAILETGHEDFKYYDNLPYWKEMVFNNRTINGPVDNLPEAEKEVLHKIGIQSVLSIPLIIVDKVWGFISFDDHRHVRTFTESEEHALRSGSTLLASAMHRNSTTGELVRTNEELTKNKQLLSAVNRVAKLILSSEKEDFPLVIQKSLKLIGESVGADRAALWENSRGEDGVLYAARLPGWKQGKTFEETESTMRLPVYDYLPQWENERGVQDFDISFDEMNDKMKNLTYI